MSLIVEQASKLEIRPQCCCCCHCVPKFASGVVRSHRLMWMPDGPGSIRAHRKSRASLRTGVTASRGSTARPWRFGVMQLHNAATRDSRSSAVYRFRALRGTGLHRWWALHESCDCVRSDILYHMSHIPTYVACCGPTNGIGRSVNLLQCWADVIVF